MIGTLIPTAGGRRRTLATARFPLATLDGLRRRHPDLTDDQAQLVADGLRQWYRVCQLARTRPTSMPSRVVDDLWHEHIVCTRDYEQFCRQAFGRFLHHQPESLMTGRNAKRNRGFVLRSTWDLARQAESETGPLSGLPLLFRLDEELGVADGHRYVEGCGQSGACTAGSVVCYAHLPVIAHRVRRTGGSSDAGSGSGGSFFGGGSCDVGDGGGGGGGDGGGCGGGGCGGGD